MNGFVGGAVLYCLARSSRESRSGVCGSAVGSIFKSDLQTRYLRISVHPAVTIITKSKKIRFFSVLMHASNVLTANSITFLFPKNARFSILGQEATLVCNVLPDIELDKRVRRYGVCCGFWFGRKPQQTLYVHARLSSSISCGTL